MIIQRYLIIGGKTMELIKAFPVPAYITCSPYESNAYGYGYGYYKSN